MTPARGLALSFAIVSQVDAAEKAIGEALEYEANAAHKAGERIGRAAGLEDLAARFADAAKSGWLRRPGAAIKLTMDERFTLGWLADDIRALVADEVNDKPAWIIQRGSPQGR